MSVKEMKTELKAIMAEANYLKGVLEAKKADRTLTPTDLINGMIRLSELNDRISNLESTVDGVLL